MTFTPTLVEFTIKGSSVYNSKTLLIGPVGSNKYLDSSNNFTADALYARYDEISASITDSRLQMITNGFTVTDWFISPGNYTWYAFE